MQGERPVTPARVDGSVASEDTTDAAHPLLLPARSGRRRMPVLVALALMAGGVGYYVWTTIMPVPAGSPAPAVEAGATASTEVTSPGPRPVRDCDDCPEVLTVPAGSFLMGSAAGDPEAAPEEQPQHQVTIVASFAIGRTEVTFAEWIACVADGGCNGYRPPHEGWGGGPRPVINVSWHDAQNYVEWLARKTGKPYRLPTEAEWEYATRAGTTTAYWWGNDIGHNLANCKTCGSAWDEQQTAPVASFRANVFGLFDVHGNVWEWVEDCWQPDYKAASTQGLPPNSRRGCSKRTLRGGSWDNSPDLLRSAARLWGQADGRDNSIGFRVALTLPTTDDAAPGR